MSPSVPLTRPVWVWSLPAVAIIISFLWYRKKRTSLQTDTGGPGEPSHTSVRVPSECDAIDPYVGVVQVAEQVVEEVIAKVEAAKELLSVDEVPVVIEVVEKVSEELLVQAKAEELFDETSVQFEAVEKTATVAEEVDIASLKAPSAIEEVCVKAEADSPITTVQPSTYSEVTPLSEEDTQITSSNSNVVSSSNREDFEESQEASDQGSVQINTAVPVEVDLVAECAEASTTASQSEIEAPKKAEVVSNASPKWGKKRKGKKGFVVNMSANSAESVEQQLAKLELKAAANGAEASGMKATAAGGERDSANTSPSEVMLASPSLSGFSDTHSEGSSDSGKGCSEVLTPSPTPVSGNSLSGDLPSEMPVHCIYEFVIPQHLVGRLIGRNGNYIHEIKDSTHAAVYIKRYMDSVKLKICAIEGTQVEIESALDMIRHKFPKKRYPNLTLEPVEPVPEPPPVLPEYMQLYLVDAVNNDVIISSLVSAGHFFVQQPTHPTYPSLNGLNSCMNLCYAEPNLPGLPDQLHEGVLCVAPVQSGWYRASISSIDGDAVDVKFVDYGGYMSVDRSQLRQIRSDFVTLPFQASECLLAGIEPVGEEGWSDEARELVETLTLGRMLQAQIHAYTEQNVPYVFLYTLHDHQVVSVNDELVAHGYAQWLLPEPVTEELESEPAAAPEVVIEDETDYLQTAVQLPQPVVV